MNRRHFFRFAGAAAALSTMPVALQATRKPSLLTMEQFLDDPRHMGSLASRLKPEVREYLCAHVGKPELHLTGNYKTGKTTRACLLSLYRLSLLLQQGDPHEFLRLMPIAPITFFYYPRVTYGVAKGLMLHSPFLTERLTETATSRVSFGKVEMVTSTKPYWMLGRNTMHCVVDQHRPEPELLPEAIEAVRRRICARFPCMGQLVTVG